MTTKLPERLEVRRCGEGDVSMEIRGDANWKPSICDECPDECDIELANEIVSRYNAHAKLAADCERMWDAITEALDCLKNEGLGKSGVAHTLKEALNLAK